MAIELNLQEKLENYLKSQGLNAQSPIVAKDVLYESCINWAAKYLEELSDIDFSNGSYYWAEGYRDGDSNLSKVINTVFPILTEKVDNVDKKDIKKAIQHAYEKKSSENEF